MCFLINKFRNFDPAKNNFRFKKYDEDTENENLYEENKNILDN